MPPLRENHFSHFGVLVCKLHTHSSPHPTWSSAWCGTSPQAALGIVITVIYFLSSSEKQDGIVHALFLQISFSLRSLEHFPCPSVFFYNIIFMAGEWKTALNPQPSAVPPPSLQRVGTPPCSSAAPGSRVEMRGGISGPRGLGLGVRGSVGLGEADVFWRSRHTSLPFCELSSLS